MATNRDDYIKARDPVGDVPVPKEGKEGDAALHVTEDEALEAELALEGLDWSKGLTRDDIKRRYRDLPLGIYLHLPDSKRYSSPAEVLHEAGVARSRAEGDFLGANPDIPSEESAGDGGPPGWGQQSGVYTVGATTTGGTRTAGATIEGGSAEDTEGLGANENLPVPEDMGN
jgi:hypothetical protein